MPWSGAELAQLGTRLETWKRGLLSFEAMADMHQRSRSALRAKIRKEFHVELNTSTSMWRYTGSSHWNVVGQEELPLPTAKAGSSAQTITVPHPGGAFTVTISITFDPVRS